MAPRGRIAVNAAFVAAGILCALFIGELFLRLTPLGQTDFYIYDSHLGWTLKPGARGWQTEEGRAWLAINRWGYRGGDWQLEKPPDGFRIAVLGDSFTEAQQVDESETFCAVMERKLAACPVFHSPDGKFDRVEVMNFGCDGYGTAQELIALKRRVWKFHPDLVVLAVFTGNDIRNNSVVLEGDKCRPFYLDRGGDLELGGPFEDSFWFRMGCLMRFESRHIQILNAAGRARSAIRAWFRSRAAARAKKAGGHSLAEPGISGLIYRPPQDQVWRDAWDVTEREISAVNRECVRHGVRFLALTLSNPVQDNRDAARRAKYANRLGVDDLFYPDRRIQALGAREGFQVLSLAQPMSEYAQAHDIALHGFSNTALGIGHWNAKGHRIAGGLIADKICGMLAAPAAPSPSHQ